MALTRKHGYILFGVAAALVLALAGYELSRPSGVVTIGTRFAGGQTSGATIRPGQPIRALLSLGRPLGRSGHVDVELRHLVGGGERLEKLLPTRAAGQNDELMIAFADVVQLVGALRGEFRLVFVHEGEVLGDGRFAVNP